MAMPTNPNTRIERYLSGMAGQTSLDDLPVPLTRVEEYLDYIARNGGGGGGGGGTTNYNTLTNKPKINGVEVRDSKTAEDYGLLSEDDSLTQAQIQALLTLIS